MLALLHAVCGCAVPSFYPRPPQGLSLLVFPAFWTVPRLMRLQATLPSAVLEGKQVGAVG